MRLYGEIIPELLARGLSTIQAHKPSMLYLTCTTITSVDLEHYGVSRAKDWLSVNSGTSHTIQISYEPALLTSEFLCPLIQPE